MHSAIFMKHVKMNQEFQPVILAAGSGSRMYPLTEDIPKALLPIGNFPMIYYPLSYLRRLGFEDVIIVVLKSEIDQFGCLKSFVDQNMRFELFPISDDEELQTAESLRALKDQVKSDLLVLSCDSLLEASFHMLADLHRAQDATFTMLLSSCVDLSSEKDSLSANKKGNKTQGAVQRDLVAVDKPEQRLLFLTNEADLDHDAIVIRKSLLKRYPRLVIENSLVDMHIYLMKNWVLQYLSENSSLTSMKGDVVPHLVRKQFSKRHAKETDAESQTNESFCDMAEGEQKPDIFSFAENDDEYARLTQDWSFCPNEDRDKRFRDTVRCFAHVNKEGICLRINTIQAYMYINRQITKMLPSLLPTQEIQLIHPSVVRKEKAQVGADCIIGELTTIGEQTSAKRSVIGKNCEIRGKVKISNSVIMDHVTIEEGCNIQGSIICHNAYVESQASLKDCQVGKGVTVRQGVDLKNEVLVPDIMDFDD